MKLLIDSHIFIWLLYEPERISTAAKTALAQADTVTISATSLWELSLKHAKGKLAYPPSELVQGIAALRLRELPITSNHAAKVAEIQLSHADPFDALLIAQCVSEGMTLLTADNLLIDSPYATIDARG